MAIIITITPSTEEILSGIPKFLTLSTNIPSTIFYTLDNSNPTIDSEIYLQKIILPTDKGNITIKAFATNGSESSEVISQNYFTSISGGRQSHDVVLNNIPENLQKYRNYPYGDGCQILPYVFGNTGGIIAEDPDSIGRRDGYDGIFFTTWDPKMRNFNLGTLPTKTKILYSSTPPERSSTNSKFLNPKAMVLYEDNTQPTANPDINTLKGDNFTLEKFNKSRAGLNMRFLGNDTGAPNGTALRSYYNPKDDTYTTYHFDSQSLRWIICKEKGSVFAPNPVTNLALTVSNPREKGSGLVIKWRPFGRRHLW